ncbi:MAG: hypothetical protein V1743_04110, partial [Nanoarchaeota archaeon]
MDYIGYAGSEMPTPDLISCDMLNPGDNCDDPAFAPTCENSGFDYLNTDEQTPDVTYDANLCCGDDAADNTIPNGDKVCVHDSASDEWHWTTPQLAYCAAYSWLEVATNINPSASDGSDACCGDDFVMPTLGPGSCSGTIDWQCSSFDNNQAGCEAVVGCNYAPSGCSGTPTPCFEYNQETCPMGQGCVWKNNGCQETTRICNPSWNPATCTSNGCTYTDETGMCVNDPNQQCTKYDEQTCNTYSSRGCVFTPPYITLNKDIGYITADQGNVCLKDKKVNEDPADLSISIEYAGQGTWSWWTADGPEAQFTIHSLLDITQFASNNEDWFYCDATGTLTNLYTASHSSREENEVLLDGPPATVDQQGFYQYWPDRDCDGYADCDTNKNGLIDDPTVQAPNWQSCYPNPAGACALAPDGKRYGENGGTNPQENCLNRQYFPNYPAVGCNSDSPAPPAPGCGSPSGSGDPIKDGYVWDRGSSNCYPENSPYTSCSDFNADGTPRDNDLDGLANCDDPDCWYTKDQNDQYVCTPPQGRENCGDFIDNNNNGHIDCDDQDCAGYSGEGLNCPGTVYTPTFSSPSSTLLCYKDSGKNIFGECCPPGKLDCYNINNPNIDDSLFALGSSTHTLVSVTLRSQQAPVLEDRMKHLNPKQDTILLSSEDWSGYESVSFDFITNNAAMTVRLNNTDGNQDTLDLASYYFDGGKPDVFHHITIPINDISLPNKKIKQMTFVPSTSGEPFKIILDNVRLKTPGTSDASQNRFCAGDGSWISDLDPNPSTFDGQDPTTFQAQMFACNAQVPQGYGGIGWTGRQCCGDDSSKTSQEFFKDIQAGCFLGSKIPEGKTVGFILNDPVYDDRLFYQGEFWSCVNDQSGLDARNSIFSSDNSQYLIPEENVVPLCTKKGGKVCVMENNKNVWKDFADAGNSCGVFDWFNHYAKICPGNECYCPKDKGNDYTDCPAENDCVADSTVIKDRLCNAGNWTTKTSLVASYLYDYAVNEGGSDYVLTCNLPNSVVYETGVWKAGSEDISDAICVLRIPGNANQLGINDAQTIVAAALNADPTIVPDSVAEIYEGQNKPKRLNVNFGGNTATLSLTLCDKDHLECYANPDNLNIKAYYIASKKLLFISNKDIRQGSIGDADGELGDFKSNLLSFWTPIYNFFKDFGNWYTAAQPKKIFRQTLPAPVAKRQTRLLVGLAPAGVRAFGVVVKAAVFIAHGSSF